MLTCSTQLSQGQCYALARQIDLNGGGLQLSK